MKREITRLVGLTAAALSFGATVQAQQTIDRTLPANSNVEIGVENIAGSVTVHPGDENQVRLHAVLGSDVDDLEIDGDSSGYYFEIEVDDDHHGRGRRDLDIKSTIELWVPVGASIEIETVSARVDVGGVAGGVAVETVSGSIDLRGVSGGVEAESVSGQIKIAANASPVYAESVSGSVEISGASGEVQAESVSGGVTIDGFSGHEAYIETVSGTIRFDGDLAQASELSVETVSGSVELLLPADLAADFDVETFSGSISNAFGGEIQQVSKYGPGKVHSFSTGDGAEVCVETMSGSVTIGHR